MDLQGWPTGSTAALATEPTNLLPGRIEGWPAGSQRDGTAATDLLAQAVAWWDASAYRDGDRFLRNRGVAGELLDLRLGSSTVANTNDPTWLGPEDVGYVYLPGVQGVGVEENFLSVPHAGTTWPTGDLDLRVRVSMDRATPAIDYSAFITKRDGSGYSYLFYINNNGTLGLTWTSNGTTALDAVSTASVGLAARAVSWVRVTLDVDNGASGRTITFYTSADPDGSSWTQVGNAVTQAGTTSVFASTAATRIGFRFIGNPLAARVYRAIVKDGIDGTTVLDVDCDAITSGSATSFTATTGQTVTINRSTSGRKSVAVPARRLGGRPCFLLGSDDFLAIPDENTWQHQLLNFGQGDSFTVTCIGRHWPTVDSTNGVRMAWKGLTSSGPRWGSLVSTTSFAVTALNDGTNNGAITGASISTGSLAILAGVVDRGAKVTTTYASASSSTSGSSSAIGSLVNTNQYRIGATAEGAFANMEFRAAAIFRRALTAAEIATITTYYTTGG